MGKCKFWIALSENPKFTTKDSHIFRVLYKDQSGDSGYSLEPLFVEADDLESARKALHEFVDRCIDHNKHMDGVSGPPKVVATTPVNNDSSVNSISIGAFRDDVGDSLPGI